MHIFCVNVICFHIFKLRIPTLSNLQFNVAGAASLWQPLTRALLIDDDRPRAKVLSHSGENCHFLRIPGRLDLHQSRRER